MTELLLQEMRNVDLDWLLATGQTQELKPDQVVLQPAGVSTQVHLLLSQGVTLALPHQSTGTLQDLLPIRCGEMVGAIPALEEGWTMATVAAQQSSWVLSLDRTELADKLNADSEFAAYFYRTQAIVILQRIQRLIHQAKLAPGLVYQLNAKAAASLFAELQDCDLDWLVAVGQVQQLSGGTVLQPAHRPTDALQIVLDGALSLNAVDMPEGAPLFSGQAWVCQPPSTSSPEIARLARGDMFGELALVQTGRVAALVQSVQVQTLRETEVLAIPRWRLMSKLLHDPQFALRFYRAIAVLISHKYQTLVTHLGFVTQPETAEFGDPLLSQMAIAEARFEWLTQRIQANIASGTKISW